LYNVGEEGEVEKSEEFTPLPAREMASAASWCHRYVGLHTVYDISAFSFRDNGMLL
jgi:hypothetical protein